LRRVYGCLARLCGLWSRRFIGSLGGGKTASIGEKKRVSRGRRRFGWRMVIFSLARKIRTWRCRRPRKAPSYPQECPPRQHYNPTDATSQRLISPTCSLSYGHPESTHTSASSHDEPPLISLTFVSLLSSWNLSGRSVSSDQRSQDMAFW
jgi:hypothetical protein